MMMSPTFMAYDSCGNPYHVTAAYAHNPSVLPNYAPVDGPTYEMVPHRIFVGGFPATTTEVDLRAFFEQFGHVRGVKVIRSGDGSSKGYGFVTFDSEDEVKAVMQANSNAENDKLEFKGRRLNLGPAIRRIVRDFALATPNGQLISSTSIGGLAYAYPQTPMMMLPSGQVQPLIYSTIPTTIAPVTSTTEQTDGRNQHHAANSPMLSPPTNNGQADVQRNRTTAIPTTVQAATYQTQQYCLSNNCVQQQIAPVSQQMQSLTPVTPSIGNQMAAIVPQGAYYSPVFANAVINDMTHYSQLGANGYFLTPNTFQSVDMNGYQPLVISTPFQPVMLTPQSTPQQIYYDDGGTVHTSFEARHRSLSRRSANEQ